MLSNHQEGQARLGSFCVQQTLLTLTENIVKQWKEHFEEVKCYVTTERATKQTLFFSAPWTELWPV